MIRIFVYGTLMRKCYNHERYLKKQQYLGPAVLPGYALFNLGSFPGIVPDSGEKVQGELYEIDGPTLKQLDLLEDQGRLYIRKSTEVQLGNRQVRAEVYVWNGKVRKADKIEFHSQPWNDGKIIRGNPK